MNKAVIFFLLVFTHLHSQAQDKDIEINHIIGKWKYLYEEIYEEETNSHDTITMDKLGWQFYFSVDENGVVHSHYHDKKGNDFNEKKSMLGVEEHKHALQIHLGIEDNFFGPLYTVMGLKDDILLLKYCKYKKEDCGVHHFQRVVE